MATITNHATASSNSSGATLDVTNITAAVGDFLLLACTADNAGASGASSTSSSITDAAGNTWSHRAQTNRTPGSASNDGTTQNIWTCKVTVALVAATITISFSPNTTVKVAAVWKIAPDAGESIEYVSVGTGTTGNATTIAATAVSVAQGDTIFGWASQENTNNQSGADSDTTNGSWSSVQSVNISGGSAATSQSMGSQYKTVTATGNQTYDFTVGNSRDWAANTLIVRSVSSGSSAGTSTAAGNPTVTGTAAGTPTVLASASLSGSSAGIATATAVAAALRGSSSGTSDAVGVPTVAGSAAGVSTAPGVAVTPESDGTAAGTSTALAVAAALRGYSYGTSTATGVPIIDDFVLSAAITEPPDRAVGTIAPGWPSSLPLPTTQGYNFSPASSVKRQQTEIGSPRVYRRTKKPPIEVSVSWQLDADQQALLDGFQRSILKEGQYQFGIQLRMPAGLALAVARFREGLAIGARGGPRWQTTATLELLSRPMMSDAALTAAIGTDTTPYSDGTLFSDGTEFVQPFDGLVWPIHLLPYPTLNGWTLTPKPAVARSDDLPGIRRTRQRSRNSTTEVPASWELNATQAAIFDAFFHYRAMDGAAWFYFPLVQAAGERLTSVRFTGDADWTYRGGDGRWAVTAQMEVRERHVLSTGEVLEVMRA